MTTTTQLWAPDLRAVQNGALRLAEVHCTPQTLATWYQKYPALEFAPSERQRRRIDVVVTRRDRSLMVWTKGILLGEPERQTKVLHVGLDRRWTVTVGFSTRRATLVGFDTRIEARLAARQWFIAYGISPDSPAVR